MSTNYHCHIIQYKYLRNDNNDHQTHDDNFCIYIFIPTFELLEMCGCYKCFSMLVMGNVWRRKPLMKYANVHCSSCRVVLFPTVKHHLKMRLVSCYRCWRELGNTAGGAQHQAPGHLSPGWLVQGITQHTCVQTSAHHDSINTMCDLFRSSFFTIFFANFVIYVGFSPRGCPAPECDGWMCMWVLWVVWLVASRLYPAIWFNDNDPLYLPTSAHTSAAHSIHAMT